MEQGSPEGSPELFNSKPSATRFQILIRIVKHQPAINQNEIADSVGLTPQSVSDYLGELKSQGYVEKHGRGRYEVTKEGVNWVLSRTQELEQLVEYVDREILRGTEVESAIATGRIEEGQRVTLSMRERRLRAVPERTGPATAVAVTSAEPGQVVGVTSVDGMVEYDPGRVTIVTVPEVQNGGGNGVDSDRLAARARGHGQVAASGLEATMTAEAAGIDPDITLGVPESVSEAAIKGIDVFVLTTPPGITDIIEQLRREDITHEMLDGTDL